MPGLQKSVQARHPKDEYVGQGIVSKFEWVQVTLSLRVNDQRLGDLEAFALSLSQFSASDILKNI